MCFFFFNMHWSVDTKVRRKYISPHLRCLPRRPQNNGKFCPGSSRFNQLCNTRPCPRHAVDFRAQQCAEYNSKPFRGWYYKWKPYTKVDGRFGPFSAVSGVCVLKIQRKNWIWWVLDNYFMGQEAQNVSHFPCKCLMYNLPRGCIFLCIHPCKRETDGLYSLKKKKKDIISSKNKQYFPWIIMISQSFLGVDRRRKETALFRVQDALYTGELNKMKAIFFLSHLCRCCIFCKLILFHFSQKNNFY